MHLPPTLDQIQNFREQRPFAAFVSCCKKRLCTTFFYKETFYSQNKLEHDQQAGIVLASLQNFFSCQHFIAIGIGNFEQIVDTSFDGLLNFLGIDVQTFGFEHVC